MVEEKKDKYDEGEYDQEGDMAKSDLRSIMANAKELHDMIDDADNLPEWCQNKITLAEDYISTVANYLTAEMSEEVKTVTVKHKTSGKELVVSPEKAKQLKPQGYHPVKEEVSKADVPAYLRKQKGEKPLTMSDVKAPRKDSISAKENLAKARNEEVEQIGEGIEVKKEYNDKTEAEHGVYHNGKKIGYVVHHKPSGTHTAYHSPQDDDDYGQIDDFRSHHDAVSQIRHSAGVGVHEEVEQIDELSNKTLYSYLRKTGAVRSSTEVHPRNTSNVPHDLQYQAQDSAKSRINARKGHGSVAPKGYAKEEVEQIDEEDAYEKDRYAVKNGKAVKDNPTHQGSPNYKDQPHHVYATSAENALKKHTKKEEVEQIDEKNEPTNPELWSRAKALARSKFDVYPSAYANGWASKWYKGKGGSWKSVSEATDPPFDKPYTTIKKVVTDKSGAKHSPMSRARDIARMAMKKQMEKMKPVKESLEESRKAEIVKEIMKKKKDKSEDAFQKDPELTTTLAKGI